MSDKEIIGFKPYNSLCHWSENIDIFITIDKLEKFLLFFGYKVTIKEFEKRNVSKKVRGSLNKHSKDRISKLYSRDMVLFKRKILQ